MKKRQRVLAAKRDEIVALYRTGEWSYESLGKKYGVTMGTIFNSLKEWMTPLERKQCQKLHVKLANPGSATSRLDDLREQLLVEYRATGISIRQLARKYNVSCGVIQAAVKSSGMTDAERTKIAIANCRKGVRHSLWRGGKRTTRDGHTQIKINGRYVGEHRHIAVSALGALPPGAIVHHVNGNKGDNRPENLLVIPSNGLHSELHHWIFREFAKAAPELNRRLHETFAAEHGCIWLT